MAGESWWVSRYELHSARDLNAVSPRRTFPGALLRMGSGFACLHPWPELGDPSLEECLADLSACPMWLQLRACVAADGHAREEGVSLFENKLIPRSHATLPVVNEQVLQESRDQGFTHVKAKVVGNLEEIRKLIAQNTDLIWRLDFNGTGEPEMFAHWSEEERKRLDFVEDPFPPERGRWEDLQVVTAADRFRVEAPVRVLKPAIEPVTAEYDRVVVTSYMDHPVGQTFAAYEAAQGAISEICGLQTHVLFENDEFTEALGDGGPVFQPAAGTGLGFDELLEKLPWKKLS